MTALLGALFPVVGLAMALIRAFDRDPKYRREAPYYFAGAVVGILVGLILIALILPMYL